MAEINPEETLRACYDKRFDYKRHFIIGDISRKFLDDHGFETTQVKDFKARVRKSKPAFFAQAGNPNFARGYCKVKVFDIEDFK